MGTKVKVGSKAYIFHDQSTGITIKKGEIKELTPPTIQFKKNPFCYQWWSFGNYQ